MRLSHTTLTILADGGDQRAIAAKKTWLARSVLRGLLGKDSNVTGSVGIYAELDEVSGVITIREEKKGYV